MTKNSKSHSQFSTLDEWLSYLETIHSTEIDLGLTRIQQVADRLSIDLDFAHVITVAGTNGKGTTCAFMENGFLHKGKSVAVYSSPHIEKFNERLRINKQDIDDASLIKALQLIEQQRAEISLTYYEFTTLAALLVLMEKKPEIIILEVGLGGRLDATNIIDADIAVITTVDLDHQAFLGDSKEAIGFEKAGIMRTNKHSVVGDSNIPHSVLQHAKEINTHLYLREREFAVKATGNSWQWQFGELIARNLVLPNIPLDNAATALTVLSLSEISLTESDINQIIDKTRVPGRTELINASPDILLDVGHNPQATTYLAEKVKTLSYPKVRVVVGMLIDKDIQSSLKAMVDVVDEWYFTDLSVPRAATAKQIAEQTQSFISEANCFDNVSQAFKMATENSQPSDLNCCFLDLFYTVAEIRHKLI